MIIDARIKKITEECNGFDSDKSHDGGSYRQPTYRIVFQSGIEVIIDDASCGDFGPRFGLTARFGGHMIFCCHFDRVSYPASQWSNITAANPVHEAICRALIEAGFGYYIIWKEECDD